MLQKGLYELNGNARTSDVGEIHKAQNLKLGHPHSKNHVSLQPTPTENLSSIKMLRYEREEVQAKYDNYGSTQCLKISNQHLVFASM